MTRLYNIFILFFLRFELNEYFRVQVSQYLKTIILIVPIFIQNLMSQFFELIVLLVHYTIKKYLANLFFADFGLIVIQEALIKLIKLFDNILLLLLIIKLRVSMAIAQNLHLLWYDVLVIIAVLHVQILLVYIYELNSILFVIIN